MSSFASIQCKLILHNLILKPPSWIKNLNTKFQAIMDPSFPLFFFASLFFFFFWQFC